MKRLIELDAYLEEALIERDLTELAAADYIKPSFLQKAKRFFKRKFKKQPKPNTDKLEILRGRKGGQQQRIAKGIDTRNLSPKGKKYKKRARGDGYKHKYAERRWGRPGSKMEGKRFDLPAEKAGKLHYPIHDR